MQNLSHYEAQFADPDSKKRKNAFFLISAIVGRSGKGILPYFIAAMQDVAPSVRVRALFNVVGNPHVVRRLPQFVNDKNGEVRYAIAEEFIHAILNRKLSYSPYSSAEISLFIDKVKQFCQDTDPRVREIAEHCLMFYL